jgi:hypothetical protein
MNEQNINEQTNTEALPNEEATEVKKTGGFISLLGKLDSVSESGLNKVLHNMPLVLFLFLLASLRIANNNMADNYARRITKTEKQVKELRWQYMTTTSDLMKKSRQSEVAQLMKKLNTDIKELRIPPYKIEVKKN